MNTQITTHSVAGNADAEPRARRRRPLACRQVRVLRILELEPEIQNDGPYT